jgi:hypothetical protein
MNVSTILKNSTKAGPSVQMNSPGRKQITSGITRFVASEFANAIARSRRLARKSSA